MSVLGHTDARVTFDLYAQVVTEQQQAAADAMGARFLEAIPRGRSRFRWMSRPASDAARGPVSRPSLWSRVGEI
jgi:hypothetical protein